jgi:hypothetical protein
MVHSFSLRPTKSAGQIPIKEAIMFKFFLTDACPVRNATADLS